MHQTPHIDSFGDFTCRQSQLMGANLLLKYGARMSDREITKALAQWRQGFHRSLFTVDKAEHTAMAQELEDLRREMKETLQSVDAFNRRKAQQKGLQGLGGLVCGMERHRLQRYLRIWVVEA